MLNVRNLLVVAISGYIAGQIIRPFGDKYSDVVVDKLQQRKERNNCTDVEETKE